MQLLTDAWCKDVVHHADGSTCNHNSFSGWSLARIGVIHLGNTVSCSCLLLADGCILWMPWRGSYMMWMAAVLCYSMNDTAALVIWLDLPTSDVMCCRRWAMCL
eukprot:GHUV01022066.1.p3 GENE.GHUV01022066.1~~GHUV01022066.1.p3  ORF type:complete len:104 (-),score=25.83 GHUV01022066.1:59-370(-)